MTNNCSNLAHQIRRTLGGESLLVLDCLLEVLRLKKRNAVLVGGVVRDLLMDQPVRDVDFMLEDPAGEIVEQIGRTLKGKVVSYEKFLTFTVEMASGSHFDFVTAREENYSAPAKLPDIRPSSFEKDLKRRDFAINAMAVWLAPDRFGELLDPFDGQGDIKSKQIRVLHGKSFIDDPTRLFRAARFSARLGFSIQPETELLVLESIQKQIPALLSPARLRNELELILLDSNPLDALSILEKWKALSFFSPDWKIVSEHKALFNNLPTSPGSSLLSLRLAAWLRPVGKEAAKKMLDGLGFEKAVKKEVMNQL